MKQYILFFWTSFIYTFSYSQNFIKGTITDSTGSAIPFCAMALLNSKDSAHVKGNISDSTGNYIFEKVKPASYFIMFTAAGFKNSSTSAFNVDSMTRLNLPTHILKAEGINLGEISIATYKPTIEFKKGIIVMNVENDMLAKGNTVLELLKRIPGIIIDAQNNITINGIGGARFLIDDRLQQMPSPQVMDMLSGMSADAVSKIELIKNPPARYDAAGTGGLINIVTKKAKVKGYNGNIGFGASKGQRVRFGPNGSFNYKSNKLSVFSNLSYGHWDGINNQILDRRLITNTSTETINSRGNSESFQRVFSGSGGIEYDLTPKTILGLYVNGNKNDDSYINTTATDINNSSAFSYGKLLYSTHEHFNLFSPNYNLSLLQKLDSTGGQIKLSGGYNNFKETQIKNNENHFYDFNDQEVAPASNYNSISVRDYKVFTQKADLNKTFKNKLSLEAGFKSSFVDNYNSNQLLFSNRSTGLFVGDTTFYNDYRYKERILAAYSTVSRSWDKIGFSVGLRAEKTDIHANDLHTDYKFTRNYFNFFPSGSLDLTLNKKHTITTAYSYRIDRPHYGMLNPIRVFNEQLNYGVGNPELKPQYTHHINIDHNYNQFITQSIGIDKTKDFTFWYSYTPEFSKVNIDTISNVPDRNNFYYSLSAQKRIKWYNFQTYGVIMYRTMKGKLNGEDISSETYNYYVNLNQEFYLPKDFKIQIWSGIGSGFQDGPQYYYARSAIHLSLQKSFLDKKLNVTLSVNDLLYRDYMSYSSTFSNQSFYWYDRFDSRRVRININYLFGKMRIQQRLNTEGDSRLKTGK
ncbi:MAG: TonB-dependent receptor [Bacteroidetes bacterium]|nr:TonB-dependent receptor [Bacteroidota bacterium]